MMDSDLAALYQVETRVFNQAVKRNIMRFPDSFRFQITEEEYKNLKSQIVTSNVWGGRRYRPYVFTEQGIAMLSAVLSSDMAIQVSIHIMTAFVEMRKFLVNNAVLFDWINDVKLNQLEYQKKTDERFEQVFDYLAGHEEVKQTKLTEADVKSFNSQYPELEVKSTEAFHDRFLIIDGDCAYHIGASLKDAGKKCFAVNSLKDEEIIKDIINRL